MIGTTIEGMSTSPAPSGSLDPRVLAAALVTVVLWASAFVVIRGVGDAFDPGSLSLLRMAIGSLGLTLIALRAGVRWPPRRVWPLLVAWGVAWFGVYNLALNAAERTIDAGTTAMIVNTAPLIVVTLAGLFLGEGFPSKLVLGAPVAFAGVVLIGATGSGHHLQLQGILLAFLAAAVFAAATLAQKVLLRHADSTTLTWLAAFTGTIALLPWGGRLVEDLATAPASATWSVVYLGVFPTAVAFTTWGYVLARSNAGTTSSTTYVVPAIALLMSWVLLAEAPAPAMLAGGLLCLLGVVIVRWPDRTARAVPPEQTVPVRAMERC